MFQIESIVTIRGKRKINGNFRESLYIHFLILFCSDILHTVFSSSHGLFLSLAFRLATCTRCVSIFHSAVVEARLTKNTFIQKHIFIPPEGCQNHFYFCL